MILKNLMEEKQLNLNRPLLSVRRFSPAAAETENKRKTENGNPRAPPVFKSELRSGPVRNPGTVPFVWEQSPGRPKYETKVQTFDHQHAPLAAPRLPPGRTPNISRQASVKVFEGTSETRSGVLGSQNAPSIENNETSEDSSGDDVEETKAWGAEDDREAYVDVPDTLSRSESFFLNCSISGVSGLDGPDMKQWGNSSRDQQSRDFMMGRFLPAAKAMASETPQYCARKQPQSRMTNNEHSKDDAHKQASVHVFQTKGMQNEWKSQSNKIPCRIHEKELNGSYLYKSLQGNASLPYKDKFSKPAMTEEKRCLGIPEKSGVNAFNSNAKGGKLFRELLAIESNEWDSAPSSPLAEKTLYIDSVHLPKSHSSPDMKGIIKNRNDEVTQNGEIEEKAITNSSLEEDELVDKTKMLLRSGEFGLQSSSDKSVDVKTVSLNSKHNQEPRGNSTSEASPKVDPFLIESTKVGDCFDMKLSNQEEISKGTKSLLPLPPPLPKSPSESWLKRALPSVSSKHTAVRSSLGLNLQPRAQDSKDDSVDLKWETIVKTAKVQHGHSRYSEELLSTIPEV